MIRFPFFSSSASIDSAKSFLMFFKSMRENCVASLFWSFPFALSETLPGTPNKFGHRDSFKFNPHPPQPINKYKKKKNKFGQSGFHSAAVKHVINSTCHKWFRAKTGKHMSDEVVGQAKKSVSGFLTLGNLLVILAELHFIFLSSSCFFSVHIAVRATVHA